MSYIVKRRRARLTGTMVELWDLRKGGAPFDEAPQERWATWCDEHGQFVTHPTRTLAESWLSHPTGWCEDCRPLGIGRPPLLRN